MKHKLLSMNLEITTACPFRCPQCYCSMENITHMDLSIAKKAITEAAILGVKSVSISGGETMCYPHLIEIIEFAKKSGINGVHAAFSGWQLSARMISDLQKLALIPSVFH